MGWFFSQACTLQSLNHLWIECLVTIRNVNSLQKVPYLNQGSSAALCSRSLLKMSDIHPGLSWACWQSWAWSYSPFPASPPGESPPVWALPRGVAALLAQQSHLLHAALGPLKTVGVKVGSKCRKQRCTHLPGICKGQMGARHLYNLVPVPRAWSTAQQSHGSSLGPEIKLLLPNSMNQAPECLISHQHCGYLCFHLLLLLLLPSSLPLHLHFPLQNEYAKFPCTFVKHRGKGCTGRKDNGFSFLCKGTLFSPIFPWGFYSEYFLSGFLILFTNFGTPVMQIRSVKKWLLLVTPHCLPTACNPPRTRGQITTNSLYIRECKLGSQQRSRQKMSRGFGVLVFLVTLTPLHSLMHYHSTNPFMLLLSPPTPAQQCLGPTLSSGVPWAGAQGRSPGSAEQPWAPRGVPALPARPGCPGSWPFPGCRAQPWEWLLFSKANHNGSLAIFSGC